jgi:hypothetical protein
MTDAPFKVAAHIVHCGPRVADFGAPVQNTCAGIRDSCATIVDFGADKRGACTEVSDSGARFSDVGPPVVDMEARFRDARALIADTCVDMGDFERPIQDTWLDIQDTLAHVLVPFPRLKLSSADISSVQHHLLRTSQRIPSSCLREPDVARRIDLFAARFAFEHSRDEIA